MQKDLTEILPFLFVSSENTARNIDLLKLNKITNIINLKESVSYVMPQAIEVLHLPLSNFGDLKFEEVVYETAEYINQIKEQGGKVLVHCKLGVNRSPAIVIAYLMLKENLNLKESFIKVLSLRKVAFPEEEYLKALIEFEYENKQERTLKLADISSIFNDI